MQIKPVWSELYTHFVERSLPERVEEITNDLKTLQHQIEVENGTTPDEALSLMRRIQLYVEWIVPELLPDQAEAAEQLVNAARTVARLAQEPEWEPGKIAPVIKAIEALSFSARP